MHLYQAYLEAAGLPPMDHRNRRVSGSHTFAASNRPPQRRQASVFSRAIAAVKAYAERRRLANELHRLNDACWPTPASPARTFRQWSMAPSCGSPDPLRSNTPRSARCA